MISFEELRPKIRIAMASWFFVERFDKRESDYHDALMAKEIHRFQSLLDQFQRYRKAKESTQLAVEVKNQSNEIIKTEDKSTT
jgi:hypothetical protein